jgi:hypothetical protein
LNYLKKRGNNDSTIVRLRRRPRVSR